jgi:hypothetical protein
MLVGICHSTCGYGRYQLDPFQMCPPNYLSDKQLSFLMHFVHWLYTLPGGMNPNRELRISVARLLREYPASMADPMESFRGFLNEHRRFHQEWLYEGDLEADYFRFLGNVQEAARKAPVRVEIDFRK